MLKLCAASSMMLIPTAITNAVPMVMCWISFLLNLSPLLGITGAYVVMVCWYVPCTCTGVSCGRGFLAFQISGQLWFSGNLCSGQ